MTEATEELVRVRAMFHARLFNGIAYVFFDYPLGTKPDEQTAHCHMVMENMVGRILGSQPCADGNHTVLLFETCAAHVQWFLGMGAGCYELKFYENPPETCALMQALRKAEKTNKRASDPVAIATEGLGVIEKDKAN